MRFIVFALMTVSAPISWGHGESQPGPHGGFIRMPGAFHSEILPVGDRQFKVFLLDINWKNPSIKNSHLELNYFETSKVKATCETKEELYFLCSFPKNLDIAKAKKGTLLLLSQREGQKGQEVSYRLPLRHEPTNRGHKDH
ncbi:MAG: hypothetical protein IPJ71_10235 [Bdellovibrionales bacterium]|nr:hypothetical protein [Bdellovibrionales bacterium]